VYRLLHRPKEITVRKHILPEDIWLDGGTDARIRVNHGEWRKIEPHVLAVELASCTTGICDVRVQDRRSGAVAEYRITFSIPDPATLDEIDEAFIRNLAREGIQHADITRFEGLLPSVGAERQYGDALGDYAVGVLLKERRWRSLAPVSADDYATKMRKSLEVLKDFERAVASSVAACVRFNLNDFRSEMPAAVPRLNLCMRFFRSIGDFPRLDPEKYAAIDLEAALHVALLPTACDTLAPDEPGNLVPRTVMEDPTLPAIELNAPRFHLETRGDPSNPIIVFLQPARRRSARSRWASHHPAEQFADVVAAPGEEEWGEHGEDASCAEAAPRARSQRYPRAVERKAVDAGARPAQQDTCDC